MKQRNQGPVVRVPAAHEKTTAMAIDRETLRQWALRRLQAWHRREFGDRTATRLGADARTRTT